VLMSSSKLSHSDRSRRSDPGEEECERQCTLDKETRWPLLALVATCASTNVFSHPNVSVKHGQARAYHTIL
jgi:hypothetical protein